MSEMITQGRALVGASVRHLADWRTLLGHLRQRKGALLGVIGVLVVLLVAIFGPLISPYDPVAQNTRASLRPPMWVEGGSAEHPLGTDILGRDVATRLVYGARNSLVISVMAMLVAALLGLVTGTISGFFGGTTDTLLMRIGDVQLAFPFVLLAIAILGSTPDRTPWHLILVMGVPGWVLYGRVVRSRVLAERKKEYVTAAKAAGAKRPRQLVRYVLPNVWQVIPVIAMLDLSYLVIMESMLSFLGFGLTPPTPSWGTILAEGRRSMMVAPWLPVLPGLAIMFTVLSINLAADGLADLFDPKLARGSFRRYPLKAPHVGDDELESKRPKAKEEAPLLRVRDMVTEFPLEEGVVRAVQGVSFDLHRGQALGIVGESGCGKSVTALSIIQLLDAPGRVVNGEILFKGIDLARVDDSKMADVRGERIGMVFQNPRTSLNPVITVGQQMTETLRLHEGLSQEEAMETAREALLSVGIGNPTQVLRSYPFELSGGMNQRVMIAMIMTAQPDLLIADEPTTSLDVTTQAQILEQLEQYRTERNTSIIFITHDIALVANFAQRILVLYAGQVCEVGPSDVVVNEPAHPYTQALLESVPRADIASGARLKTIPGDLPDPMKVPPGCPFADRCSKAMDVCRNRKPAHVWVGPDHRAACHLCTPVDAKVVA